MTRTVMWALLAIVATAAAVLSFDALRNLAVLCGFSERLAWLLPVVVDAGAGCGCLIWLGTSSPVRALRFARALTWVLLASSVAGNAVVHYLAAYGLRPTWWLVVMVSAIAPAVLGAVVHLSVLVGRSDVAIADSFGHSDVHDRTPEDVPAPPVRAGNPSPKPPILPQGSDRTVAETKARALLASNPGMGRRALMAATGLSEYEARKLLESSRAPRNGVKVLEEAK